MNEYYRLRERKNAEMKPYLGATIVLLIVLVVAAATMGPLSRFVGRSVDQEASYQRQRLNASISQAQREEIVKRWEQ